MAYRNAEIALARSAVPEAISREAKILVLERHGYETAVEGKNGFVCVVDVAFRRSGILESQDSRSDRFQSAGGAIRGSKTPRAAAAWCHVRLIFPDSCYGSNICRSTVFNISIS